MRGVEQVQPMREEARRVLRAGGRSSTNALNFFLFRALSKGRAEGFPSGGIVAGAGTRALTVSEIIDRQPLSRLQISAIALCGLVLLLDGFDTQCIGFLAPSISQNLAIPLKSFGRYFPPGSSA